MIRPALPLERKRRCESMVVGSGQGASGQRISDPFTRPRRGYAIIDLSGVMATARSFQEGSDEPLFEEPL